MDHSAMRSLETAVQTSFAIPADDAAALVSELEPIVIRGGDWLFRQGDAADSMYLLARGRLQVWVNSNDSIDGGSRLVAEVEPGETIGEIGMLTGEPRSASIRAVRASLLLKITSSAFDRLAQPHPQLMRHVAGGLAERLRARTAGEPSARRRLTTFALVPLDSGETAARLADELSKALEPHGSTLVLSSQRMRELGAPPLPTTTHGEISAAMVGWLAHQEDEHRFILYVADPRDSAWSDLAVRHSDLILLIANANGDPTMRSWESTLLDTADGPVARRALILCHEGRPAQLTGTSRWLVGRNLSFHLHLRSDVSADLPRLARVMSGTAVGLVLGGGAARGFAHLGVYRALIESGTQIDWFAGSSIGAVMAASMASGLSPDDAIDKARSAFVHGKPFGDVTLPIVSLLRGRRMERLIGEHLSGEIEDMPLPFFCVSSNLGQGTVQVHDSGSLTRALRASVSLPGIFPPAVIDRQLAIDGGILDNLPVDLMRERPVGRVVAVDVSSRRNQDVEYEAVPSPWSVLISRAFPFVKRHPVPSPMSLVLMAMSIGTLESSRIACERADIAIRPPVGKFSFTDVRPFDQIVKVGYEAGRAALIEAERSRNQQDHSGAAR